MNTYIAGIIRKILIKNRQSSIYKLFFSYIAVIFIIVIMMFLIIYKYEQNLINNWLVKNSISAINNTKDRIDETIFKDKIDYVTLKILQDFFSTPELSEYLSPANAQLLYDYKTEKYMQQYLQSLSSSIASTTTLISNISIFYKANNHIVSLNGSFQPTKQDKTDIFGAEDPDTSYTYPFLREHMTKYNKLTGTGYTSDNSFVNFIRKIPDIAFPNTCGGSIIVTINENNLYKEFEEILKSDSNAALTGDTALMIIDRNGNIISAKNKNLLSKNIGIYGIKLDSGSIPDFLIKSVNNKDFIFTFKPSEVTDFVYLSFTPMSTVTSSFSLIFKLLLIVTVFTLIAGLILSAYSTRNIFTPLLKIRNACLEKLEGHSLNITGPLNEYTLINSAIDTMSDKLESHEKALKRVKPIVGQHILDTLLSRNGNMGGIIEEFNITDTNFARPFNVVIMVRTVYEHSVLNESMYLNSMGGEITAGMETILGNADSDFITGNVEKDIIFLINCCDPNRTVDCLLAYISKYFSNFSGLKVIVGISNIEKSIENASDMYEQALTCLKYSFLYPDDNVLNYREVCEWEHTYPENIEKSVEKINKAILQGMWDNFNNMIDTLVEDIMSERYSYSHIFRLMGNIRQTIGSIASRFNIELDNDILISHKLPKNVNTLPEYAGLLKQIGNHISSIIKNRNENKNLLLVEKAKRYIDVNIADNNVSLNYIAELMNISPAHLSRVFKDITGMNFVDYLTASKLEYSRYLLLNTSDKINDISVKTGYSNVHYFISKFKACYGTTPNDYRLNKNRQMYE